MFYLFAYACPLALSLGAGFFFYLGERAIRSHRWVGCAVSVTLATIIVWVLHSTASDDLRLPTLTPFLCLSGAISFIGPRALVRQQLPKAISILAGVAMVPMIALELFATIFSMHPSVVDSAVSPDGRYTAQIIYTDGLTFGYDYVCIKSNSLFARWQGADEIAEADCEGFEHLKWYGPHTVAVQYAKGSAFVSQDNKWRDIAITYEPRADSNR